MAKILLLESSTEVCSVALSSDGKLVDIKESVEGMNHSKLLTVYIEELLQNNKLDAKDLEAVAVSKGPGSYTGLRIGVSAAKGICFAAGLPLIAISTLDAMANYFSQNPGELNIGINKATYLCPMIDARRMEVYTAVYDSKGEKIVPISAEIINEDSFSKYLSKGEVLFFGNGAAKCREAICSPNAHFEVSLNASARFMIYLAEESYNKNAFEDVAYFEPFYLKDFVATIPKNKLL